MMSEKAAEITCLAGDNFPATYDDIPVCPIVPDDLALITGCFPKINDEVHAEVDDALG